MNYLDLEYEKVPFYFNGEIRYSERVPKEYLEKIDEIPKIISGETIRPQEILWLWKPYIPFGKVTLVAGDPGTGKSTFVLDLVAKLTRGEKLPFSSEEHKPMNVIYQCSEDDLADTVMPRFNRSGGDPTHIQFIDESRKTLTFDDERLELAIAHTGSRVVVLDPFSSYIGGDTNMNSANEIRSKMNYLITLAKRWGLAIIVVCHLNKNTKGKALYRASGSVDVVGSVRSALLITKGKEPSERYVTHMKSNLAKEGLAIVFQFNEDGKIEILRQEEKTADEVSFEEAAAKIGRPDEKYQLAKEIILEELQDGGFAPANEIVSKLEERGVSHNTWQKVKKELNIESNRLGNVWFWTIKA